MAETDRICLERTVVGMWETVVFVYFFFSSRRRHTRYIGDWSSDVCSSDLVFGHIDEFDVCFQNLLVLT